MSVIETDLCVVGAGILGLAHAYEARAQGLRVVVLDRDRRAVGASVRNFGHVFVGAMASGAPFERALAARARWLELGRAAGIEPVQAGSLVVARAQDELGVLADAAGDRHRQARMLTAQEAGRLAPIPTAELLGALHSPLDLRVDPRAAVAALAAQLGDAVHWGACVESIEPGLVAARGLQVRAPLIVVCPGPGYAELPAALRTGLEELTRCKLQMLRIAAPSGRSYAPALVTGLSLIRYPGFAGRPAAAGLRERLARERPELLEAGIHLLVTQLPDGDLIIGDTHEYGETVSPFGDERLDELLLAEARRLLGASEMKVRERWHGIYPSAGGDFVVTAPMEGVRVVEVVCGLGMTLSFGIAPEVIAGLTGGQQRAA
jgi:FAD dependent oxidoreductase TIGR03364